MLINFEEELAAYYQALAEVDTTSSDLWQSGSLAKMGRAGLYGKLQQDITQNPQQYGLERGATGMFMGYLNKVKSARDNIKATPGEMARHIRFLTEIETVLSSSNPVFPSIRGNTELFRKVYTVLSNIQSSQVRVIKGYTRLNTAYK